MVYSLGVGLTIIEEFTGTIIEEFTGVIGNLLGVTLKERKNVEPLKSKFKFSISPLTHKKYM